VNQDALPLRVERLTPARRDDYLRFFDHERGEAFRDNAEWAPCYCHFHHVSTRIDFDALAAAANRIAMDARIACAEMEGYLAYRNDAVVGWLNAQTRNRLRHCDARIGVPPPTRDVPDHEAAAIVCFVIAPAARGQGIARALLSAALDDLAVRGVRIVDAYPRAADSTDAPMRDHFRGPRPLFAAAGFHDIGHHGGVRIMRKRLAGAA
jgi:ribosomal protein S18 acetylase RimI-like enzyme